MAAFAAGLLLLTALGAVVARVTIRRTVVSNLLPGDPVPPLWSVKNRYIIAAVAVAFVMSVLLLFVHFNTFVHLNTWVAIVPFLLALFMMAVLICMTIDWPDTSNIGEAIHSKVWGYSYPVTDSDIDDRLDWSSPNYDPLMDETNPAFSQAHFDTHAMMKDTPRYGVLAFFGAAALSFVWIILAWIIAALIGSFGGSDNSSATKPAPVVTTQAPASVAPATTQPSQAAPTTAPTTETPKAAQPTDLGEASCDAITRWMPQIPQSKQAQTPFYPEGVEFCKGSIWKMWTGESPQTVIVIRSYKDTTYQYYLFQWKGQYWLVRVHV